MAPGERNALGLDGADGKEQLDVLLVRFRSTTGCRPRLRRSSRIPAIPASGRSLRGLLHSRERRVDVVVYACCNELATLAPDVDGEPCLRRQLRLAPAYDVVLQRTRARVVDHSAMLRRDSTAIREQMLVERT